MNVKRKQRGPLFVFIFCWLLILLIVPLRHLFWAQASGRGEVYRGWVYGPFPAGFWGSSPVPDEPPYDAAGAVRQWQRVAEAHPHDARLQAVVADALGREGRSRPGLYVAVPRGSLPSRWLPFDHSAVRTYDDLIKRFPDQPWLIARRLDESLGYMSIYRVGGELSDTDVARIAKHQSPEKEGEPNYTPRQLNDAIAAARLGQKREPDNAYFDWMLFCFLMKAWRDDEAWRVLQKASHKPRFDAHWREWTDALLAAHEAKWNRPLLWEEEIAVRANVLLPAFAREREIARIAVWEAVKAGRRRGNHAKALQIYSDLARLHNVRAENSYFAIETILADDLIAMAFSIEGRDVVRPSSPLQTARQVAAQFSRYANKHRRPDVAREINRISLARGKRYQIIRAAQNGAMKFGLSRRALYWSVRLYWAAALVLLFLPVAIVLWCLLTLGLRLAHVPAVAMPQRDLCWVTGAAAGAALLCVGVGLWGGVGQALCRLLEFGWMLGGFTTPALPVAAHLIFVAGALAPFCMLLWLSREFASRRENAAVPAEKTPFIQRCFARLSSVRLFAFGFNVAWGLCFVAAMAFWVLSVTHNRQMVAVPLPDILLSNWSAALPTQYDVYMPASAAWWGMVVGTCAFAAPLLRLPFAPIERARAALRLRLMQQALGALIVGASLFYLLLLAASLPVRAGIAAQMQQASRSGEVKLLLKAGQR